MSNTKQGDICPNTPVAGLRTRSILHAVIGLGLFLIAWQVSAGKPSLLTFQVLRAGDLLLGALWLVAVGITWRQWRQQGEHVAWPWLETAVGLLFVVSIWIALAGAGQGWGAWPGVHAASAVGKLGIVALAISLCLRAERLIRRSRPGSPGMISPPVIVMSSFATVIVVGALLLALPEASSGPTAVKPLDALFTATSATCVTGLIVLDTPRAFSRFGLIVILLLMQVGGLGIMTLAGLFSALTGQRLSLPQRLVARDTIVAHERGQLATLFAHIAYWTLFCEALGATLLFIRWLLLGEAPRRAAALAIFHSVSAFCNAGFSLFSDSFVRHVGDWWITFCITGLIIAGGIGFPVVSDIAHWWQQRRVGERARLSLHTQLTLRTTGWLLAVGFGGFLLLEWHYSLRPLTLAERFQAAWFQAVTPRTCGFNSVPMEALSDAARFLLVLLMFVGASPGSTGGGIKTTTLAVLAALTGAMIRQQAGVQVLGRELPESVRHRAVAIVALYGLGVLLCTFVLLVTEKGTFLDLLFETVSAFGTVGLSTFGSSNLTLLGRVAIILAMYLGRVGPLTVTLAIVLRKPQLELRRPEEAVMVG